MRKQELFPQEQNKTRTRFAPSPTGYLHVGGARTALYSWLYAKHNNGEFVLRIEDTDLERSTPQATEAILEGMDWLDLRHDFGPYYQTKRFDRYNEVIDQMLEKGLAYYCFHTKEELDQIRDEQMANKQKPKAPRTYRDLPIAQAIEKINNGEKAAVRFKNPLEGNVVFDDKIRGEISISNDELDDLIIRRTDGSPTYNFCVVIDDWDMGITDVVRGEDHINNTPRQINILRALNAPVPHYAHVSMILGDDGKKLSKRHGAVSVMEYRDQGYLPKALVNYLVRLGWGDGDREVFSVDEMIEAFELTHVSKSASAFNTSKLNWLNHHYIKTEPTDEIIKHLEFHLNALDLAVEKDEKLAKVVDLLRERSTTLKEMAQSIAYFYQDLPSYDENAVKKHFKAGAVAPLEKLTEKLTALSDFTATNIHSIMNETATELELGMGKVGMPLRVALTFGGQSPSIDAVAELIGKEKVLSRIEKAISFIKNQ